MNISNENSKATEQFSWACLQGVWSYRDALRSFARGELLLEVSMMLLLDVGNTHTHIGLAEGGRIQSHRNVQTSAWMSGSAQREMENFVGNSSLPAAAFCSVVPAITPLIYKFLKTSWKIVPFELTSQTTKGIGIDYPNPQTIGPDRLANAIAARQRCGAPVIVVDFGTTVTFDVVDRKGNYVGGIIAPGLTALTTYLHEKTALLPMIEVRETDAIIGKSTEEAMLIGAVRGYRGLIRELVKGLQEALSAPALPVIATGGYAALMASKLPEITSVEPLLTLEGLRLAFEFDRAA